MCFDIINLMQAMFSACNLFIADRVPNKQNISAPYISLARYLIGARLLFQTCLLIFHIFQKKIKSQFFFYILIQFSTLTSTYTETIPNSILQQSLRPSLSLICLIADQHPILDRNKFLHLGIRNQRCLLLSLLQTHVPDVSIPPLSH